jgi:hypothetical protein
MFFASWEGYGGQMDERQLVVVFGKRHNMIPTRDQFAVDYPDGRMLTLVRDPVGWFASARDHQPRTYPDVDSAMAQWRASCEASLAAARHGSMLLTFEQLVGEVEGVTRNVCEHLGLEWSATMLQPTFNGAPVESNSTFSTSTGVDVGAINRGTRVDETERRQILESCADLYDQARRVAAGA